MPQRHRLASVSDLADGQGREFVVEGRIIALFRIGDRWLAVSLRNRPTRAEPTPSTIGIPLDCGRR